MKMPLISVIIPCYNVEKYIDRCMISIVNQTIGIDNLEIILVNDASTDGTLVKLKEWEQKYSDNIVLVDCEENIRQGGARNIGMQYARADYIGFVDADDWIEPDMYELLYEPLKNYCFYEVRGKLIRDKGNGRAVIDNSERSDIKYFFKQIDGFYVHDVEDTSNVGEYGGIVTAIYLRKYILENNIWFPEGIAYEDNYWGAVLELYIPNLYIVDKIIYHYFVNTSSTVTARNAEHQLDRLDIEVGIIEEYKRRGAYQYFEKRLEWNFIQRFYLNTLYIIFTRFDYIPDIFEYMRSTVFEYFPDYKNNPNINKVTPREEQLLRLLEIPSTITVETLERVKKAYMNL